jgi:hypothetical protein
MNKKQWIAAGAVLLLAVTAFAQTEVDFVVRLMDDNEGVVIERYIGKAAAVRIPATIQGVPVREIDGAFKGNAAITSVVIPDGVRKIEYQAFSGTTKLKTVSIPEGVTLIGDFAFSNSGITAVLLPNSLIEIGICAFAGTKISTIILPSGVTKIGVGAFSDCASLKTVNLPEGIKEIPGAMFSDCTALIAFTLPASVTSIGRGAFKECTALTTITIAESVETLEFHSSNAFVGCPKISLINQASLRKFGYKGSF